MVSFGLHFLIVCIRMQYYTILKVNFNPFRRVVCLNLLLLLANAGSNIVRGQPFIDEFTLHVVVMCLALASLIHLIWGVTGELLQILNIKFLTIPKVHRQ